MGLSVGWDIEILMYFELLNIDIVGLLKEGTVSENVPIQNLFRKGTNSQLDFFV